MKLNKLERVATGALGLFVPFCLGQAYVACQGSQRENTIDLTGRPLEVISSQYENPSTDTLGDENPGTLTMVGRLEDGTLVKAVKRHTIVAKNGSERLLSQDVMSGNPYPSIRFTQGYATKASSDTLEAREFMFEVPSKEANAYK